MFKFYNYNIILPKYLEIVKKKGSSFVLPALGVAGQGRLNINSKFPSPKFRAKPKQTGKKEGGLGEGIFARLLCPPKADWGWESVSAIPASAGRQNRKIFFSFLIAKQLQGAKRLVCIEKNFGGVQLKNVKKIFLFCSPSGERKRWAGFNPQNPEDFAQNRFVPRSVNPTRRNFQIF